MTDAAARQHQPAMLHVSQRTGQQIGRCRSSCRLVGVPRAAIRPLTYGLEGLIDKDLCQRNTLEVYARKPARP